MKILHVGCGRVKLPEWFKGYEEIRLDLDPEANPDILGGMDDIPLPDESVNAIYTSHTLEHVYYNDAIKTLREFLRVLSPSGMAMVIVPDVKSIAQRILDDDMYGSVYEVGGISVSAADMLYGHQGLMEGSEPGREFRFCHKFGYTPKTLGAALATAGFSGVKSISDGFNAIAVGIK